MLTKEKTKLINNTGWQLFQQVYSMLVSLVRGSISARYLGPTNYGLIGYSNSLVQLFISFSSLGMSSIIIKELVNNPERRDEIVGTAILMRLCSSILSIIIIYSFVSVMHPDNQLLKLVSFLQSLMLIFQVTEIVGLWFQATLKYKFISLGSIIATSATGVWRIILLVKKLSVEWFALSSSISVSITGLFILCYYIFVDKGRFSFCFSTAKNILSKSYHFIISGVAVALYTRFDLIMIENLLGEEMTGFYTAASTIAVMWEFVPNAIIVSLQVKIYENKGLDNNEYKKYLDLLFGIIIYMGLVVGIVFMLLGKYVVLILYGKNYMSSITPLKILIWSTCFAMIGSARSPWIISEQLHKYSKYYLFIGCILNIILIE